MRQNEVVKRLAGWGAILAIPTMLFSMYGMNFKYMPELDSPYGYPVVRGDAGRLRVAVFPVETGGVALTGRVLVEIALKLPE